MVGIKGAISEFYLVDLAAKTKRGQVGRVKAGRIPGGRSYGYDVVRDGEGRGRRTINEAEAVIVRRIFDEYVSGRSPLKIVQALNIEHIAGPRGGHWNVSALLGSAKRRNGVLNNSLYRGRITYNRQRFIKDPATGRRQARTNPRDQWLTQEVPELAIVSPETFDAAQARRDAFGRINPQHHRRPKHLLSGLLECASCGAKMIVRNRTGSVTNFGCSARLNRAGCDNGRSVGSVEIEGRVLAALKRHLLAPDVIAAAIEAYRIERQRLTRDAAKARGSVERDLADIKRKVTQVIRAIEDGGDTKMLAPRINELGAQQQELEARLSFASSSDVVELHPHAAARYAAKVSDIQSALSAGDVAGQEAVALVRDLIRRVRVIPTPRGQPVGLEIAGDLAALLTVNEEGTLGRVTMVAGTRNRLHSPATTFLSTREGRSPIVDGFEHFVRQDGKFMTPPSSSVTSIIERRLLFPSAVGQLSIEDGAVTNGKRAAC